MTRPKLTANNESVNYCKGCATHTAEVIIRELNNELKEKGKIVINGRVPKKYFEERVLIE